jgi:hypothetical protein
VTGWLENLGFRDTIPKGSLRSLPPMEDLLSYGESVLVHLGFNEWLIVDSCVVRGSKVPAPIESRNSLRLSPTKPRRELRSDPTWVGSLRHRCTADQGE